MKSLVYLAAAALAACGGGAAETKPTPPPAVAAPAPVPPDVAASGEPSAPAPAPAPVEERPAIRPPTPLPKPEGKVIELKNEGDGDLLFGTTKGWQPVIFAYTGKPPKAKPILLFESYCTASCAAPEGEICPVCKEPKNKKEELAMAKYETASAGGSVKVPWDGKVFVYQAAPGKHKCKCWNKSDPPPDTYTIKACGLRPSKTAGKASKPTCAETQVVLGPGDASPPTITLSFK